MPVRLSALAERLRASLFFVPMVFVVVAIGLAVGGLSVDTALLDDNADLPLGLTSTVDSARAVLSTVASATITVAGIAFSISLLLFQQTSSQYSPRVVQGLFRDPFNKRVMGVVVGTFTYCLVVLHSVRSPLESAGEPVIPNLSVGLALVLGVVSILAIMAFISHSAHTMDVSKILEGVSSDARHQIRRLWREPGDEPENALDGPVGTAGDGLRVDLKRSGWIQQIDFGQLGHAADPGGVVRAEIAVGRYAVQGTPLCTVTPRPRDGAAAAKRAQRAVITGETRTVQQDVSYGIRQLADVALKGLSPGINDPTTAQDALFHIGSVLREILVRRPPPLRRAMPEGRVLVLAEEKTPRSLVNLAFDEIRLAAEGMPTVCTYLLEVLHLIEASLDGHDADEAVTALRAQAGLIRDGADRADLLPHDRNRIREAHDARFGSTRESTTAGT